MIEMSKDRRNVLLKHLVRYGKFVKCDLCSRAYESWRRALLHFTKDELIEIASIEAAKRQYVPGAES